MDSADAGSSMSPKQWRATAFALAQLIAVVCCIDVGYVNRSADARHPSECRRGSLAIDLDWHLLVDAARREHKQISSSYRFASHHPGWQFAEASDLPNSR